MNAFTNRFKGIILVIVLRNIGGFYMKKILSFLLTLILIISITACSKPAQQATPAEPVELNISAAASLKDALLELQPAIEEKHNVTLVLNFASSGALQKQIEEGAPCDVFISAAKKQMDALEEKDIILKDSRKNLLSNDLVLIASDQAKDIIKDINDITKSEITKISIGAPESVPAGNYAKESLENLNLWKDVEPKLVYGKDVRQVLTYVETGEVEAGAVYSSDAALLKKGAIVAVFPEDTHKPIVYPAALLKESKNQDKAAEFLSYLSSDEATQVLVKYGFIVLK